MLRTNGHQLLRSEISLPQCAVRLQLPIHVFTWSLDTSCGADLGWTLFFYLPIPCPGLLKERETDGKRHRNGCACPIFAFYPRLGTS